MKTLSHLLVNKSTALFLIVAIAGLISLNAFAYPGDHIGFGGFGYAFNNYGYGFGGYGMNFNGFGHADFGGAFAGFGHDMDFGGFGYSFAGFDGFNHGFTAHTAVPNSIRKIVPIPATASATNSSITYDENGEIHVRPFDDEDLFVED